MIKQCTYCGGDFEVDGNNRNEMKRGYCSDLCRHRAQRARRKNGPVEIEKVCLECGKAYIAKRCDSVTCSSECNYERTKKRSKETGAAYRAKMRAERLLQKEKVKKKKKAESIPEFNRKAREMGKSYGQYDVYLRTQKGEV